MLHFLVTAGHEYTLSRYFSQWGACLHSRVSIIHYESRPWRQAAAPGVWVFTDLERLDPDELADAKEFANHLKSDPSRWRILNDPARVLCRYELLQRLADAGVNQFRVYRLAELPATVRYPLFLRRERDHSGRQSPLLASPEALRDALAQDRSLARDNTSLAVEYLPYQREDGLFVKYSVMRAGLSLVPRHMLFSRDWEVKFPDLVDDALLVEEEEYLADMPHTEEMTQLFDLAGIDYGRIDYTLVDGRIQVFEINTNPTLVPGVENLDATRWTGQAISARQLNEAFRNLSAGLPEPDAAEMDALNRAAKRQAIMWQVRRIFRLRASRRL
jgi:hypothetical protein